MASSIQLLRSTNPQERPFAGNLLEGQPAANLHSSEPGLFFKTTDGSVVKFGPAAITSDGSPPNSTPQGSAGNSVGELWLDKSVDPAVLKVYDGTEWVNAGSGGGGGGGGAGSFVRWIYTSAGGETSLSGSSGGVLLDYTPGLEEVYVNGVLITRGTDYSAINGTSITNLVPLTAGDVVTVLSMNPLETVQLPGQVTLLRWSILAAAGQTVLSGIDSSSQQLAYTAGFEEVYVNGAFLRRGIDYTTTGGSSITISTPLAEDDEVTVMAWSALEVGSISIDTDDIVDLAVTTGKLDNGAVTNAKVSSTAEIDSSKLLFNLGSTISGAEDRTVESKLQDFVSVKDFGAVGDGINDDSDAIQAALNYQRTYPGKAVYFPGGRYKITKTLQTWYLKDSNNQNIAATMYGDGPLASVIEWHGTTPMTQARYAMLYTSGWASIKDMSLTCPRNARDKSGNKLYPGIYTPYYGIVATRVFWMNLYENLHVLGVHVPFNGGTIKRIAIPSLDGTQPFEFEPPTGGSSFNVTGSRDIASNAFVKCRFRAQTDEFFDGTFDPDTTLNANGTNLLRGTADVSPLRDAAFSDGSWCMEFAIGQTVGNSFYGCNFSNVQPPHALGVVRVEGGIDLHFIGCMFSGISIVNGNLEYIAPAFFENVPGGGSAIYASNCYFSGAGLSSASTSAGVRCFRDCHGEWGRNTDLLFGMKSTLAGDSTDSAHRGPVLILDNFKCTKLTRDASFLRMILDYQTRDTSAKGGAVGSEVKNRITNLQNGPWIINFSGTQTTGSFPSKPQSLSANFPGILRNSSNNPEDLSSSVYTAVVPRQGFSNRALRRGSWFMLFDLDSSNVFRPVFVIDPEITYHLSFDVWIKIQPGEEDNIGGSINSNVYWRSASNINTLVNGSQPHPLILGGGVPTRNYGLLGNNSVKEILVQNITPPTNAGYLELTFTGAPNSSKIVELGVGNFRLWDALHQSCDPFTYSL